MELAIAQTPAGTTITQQVFGELCATCGLWTLIRDRVLPTLAVGGAQVDELMTEFRSKNMDSVLHKSIRSLRGMEPNEELKNFGDLAARVMANVSAVRSCHQVVAKHVARHNGGSKLET